MQITDRNLQFQQSQGKKLNNVYILLTGISFQEWEKIDLKEMMDGNKVGKPREKITDVNSMVAVAKG